MNVARAYFFDSKTKLLSKSAPLTGITYNGTNASGNVIYETEPISVPMGIYDIFVIANTNRQFKKDKEDEFLADIDSLSYVQAVVEDISEGIIMSNRASENLGTVISKKNDNELFSEIFILKSPTTISNVVTELGINTRYYHLTMIYSKFITMH